MIRRPSTARGPIPALLALALTCLAVPATAVAAAPREQRALEQQIDREQAVATDRAVLSDGHIDMGPLLLDGRWALMIHDDAAKSGRGESVWRAPERTVLRVSDAARHQAPDDPAYDFLRAEPGADLYVIPQTQDLDVVWLGWNTQDPSVMERIDRGVTMTLEAVEGPGSLIVYLQSGDFAEPRVLWDSEGRPRPVWVDVNTHTHANWVFSEPGTYLARVRIEADLIDGRRASDTRELRFAVGSATDVDEAFAARWRGQPVSASGGEDATPAAAREGDDGAGGSAGLIAAIAVVAVALAGGLALMLVRGAGAKRRARARSTGSGTPGEDPEAGR